MAPPLPPVFTIGHATRSMGEFTALLAAGAVQTVVDIRKIPRSRTNPQYNLDVLGAQLAPAGIAHARIEALGGLRGKTPGIAPEVNGYWTNASFHRYADYALTPAFADGLAALLALAEGSRVAIMCSESVWWRCHRRIVADYLIAAGREVFHLMGTHTVAPAALTPAAVRAAAELHYPLSNQ